jgi:hypothetical protein
LSNFLPLEDDFPCCTGSTGTNNTISRASILRVAPDSKPGPVLEKHNLKS